MTYTVLVTGATGYRRSVTARDLLGANIRVDSFFQDPSKPAAQELKQLGAELCVGSFDNIEALKRGCKGTSTFYSSAAMTVLDPDDVGSFASEAFVKPEVLEIDLSVEAPTPDEVAKSLSRTSGEDVTTEFYTADEAAPFAKLNPVVYALLWANEVGYQADVKALSKYPLKLRYPEARCILGANVPSGRHNI